MTIHEWLKDATSLLAKAGVPTARLDALVLLSDAYQKDKSWLLAHDEESMPKSIVSDLEAKLARRANHEPLAYIRGKAEFYGRDFVVSADTLQPRPETETMIKLFKELGINSGLILDIGTGSGCIGLTLKLEIPELEVWASDINSAALKIAKLNAKKTNAIVKFCEGDLLTPLKDSFPDLAAIVCNLPYVPDNHTINQAAMQEPKIAIFGGSDGLDLYRKLFKQMSEYNIKPQYFITESLPFQHAELAKIAKVNGFLLRNTEDFIQVFSKT